MVIRVTIRPNNLTNYLIPIFMVLDFNLYQNFETMCAMRYGPFSRPTNPSFLVQPPPLAAPFPPKKRLTRKNWSHGPGHMKPLESGYVMIGTSSMKLQNTSSDSRKDREAADSLDWCFPNRKLVQSLLMVGLIEHVLG